MACKQFKKEKKMNTIKKYSGYFTITECVDFILQNIIINLKAVTIRYQFNPKHPSQYQISSPLPP